SEGERGTQLNNTDLLICIIEQRPPFPVSPFLAPGRILMRFLSDTRRLAMRPPRPKQKWQAGEAGNHRAVQHAFVNCRLHEINKPSNQKKLIDETLTVLSHFVKGDDKALLNTFWHLTKRLQTADLTINFQAAKWFLQPNTYTSYTQMYERALGGGTSMVLKDDALNPAVQRAAVDDRVTFPSDWLKVEGYEETGNAFPGQGVAPRYLNTAKQWKGRGLSPDAVKARTVAKMSPGPLVPVCNADGSKIEGYGASAPQFDPRTKQVFAALNYGRRCYGANTTYGSSHLVLADKYKTNALYFAADTFHCSREGRQHFRNTSEHQVSYAILGVTFAKAPLKLRQALHKSCIQDMTCLPTRASELMIEAHIFEQVVFKGGLKAVALDEYDLPLIKKQRDDVLANAQNFAAQHSAAFTLLPKMQVGEET